MKIMYTGRFVTKKSEDVKQSLTQSAPIYANKATRNNILHRKAKEVKELHFYPYAHYDITFNSTKNEFFQSQMAILLNVIPTLDEINNWKPIKVMVAPPGCKKCCLEYPC